MRRPLADPRAARDRAERAPVGDRGAAADAPQQPRSPRWRSGPRSSSSTAARARRRGTTRRCARSSRALLELGDDETLLVQSGKPVGVFRTHAAAPRVLIANSLLVPRWATWDEFRRLEAEGLTMFGQMTAGLVDLHRHAGDPAGDVPDVRGRRREALRLAGPARADDPDRRARRHGRRAAARRRRWRARRSSASRSIRRGSSAGSRRATSTRRRTRSTTRSRECAPRRPSGGRFRSGCSGMRPTSSPSLLRAGRSSTWSPTRRPRTIR